MRMFMQTHIFIITTDETDTILFSEKCLSFTDTSFTTTYLYTNMKPNFSSVVIFILIEQKGSIISL